MIAFWPLYRILSWANLGLSFVIVLAGARMAGAGVTDRRRGDETECHAASGKRLRPPTVDTRRVPVLSQRVIEFAHALGLRVIAWTVDDPSVIDTLLLDRGVDGVITDRPDVLRERLVARGEWEPWNSSPTMTAAVRADPPGSPRGAPGTAGCRWVDCSPSANKRVRRLMS